MSKSSLTIGPTIVAETTLYSVEKTGVSLTWLCQKCRADTVAVHSRAWGPATASFCELGLWVRVNVSGSVNSNNNHNPKHIYNPNPNPTLTLMLTLTLNLP